eukprot:2978454-Prymnesium_polylepis.1
MLDLANLPDALPVRFLVGCPPGSATLWPRVDRNATLATLLPAPSPLGRAGPLESVQVDAQLVSRSLPGSHTFLSVLLDALELLTHEVTMAGRRDRVAQTSLAEVLFTADKATLQATGEMEVAPDKSISGAVNVSFTSTSGEAVKVVFGFGVANDAQGMPIRCSIHGATFQGNGRGYQFESKLDTGNIYKVFPAQQQDHGRSLSLLESDAPEPVRFSLSVSDLFGTDFQLQVSFDLAFASGRITLASSVTYTNTVTRAGSLLVDIAQNCLWRSCSESEYSPVAVVITFEPTNLNWFDKMLNVSSVVAWQQGAPWPITVKSTIAQGLDRTDVAASLSA